MPEISGITLQCPMLIFCLKNYIKIETKYYIIKSCIINIRHYPAFFPNTEKDGFLRLLPVSKIYQIVPPRSFKRRHIRYPLKSKASSAASSKATGAVIKETVSARAVIRICEPIQFFQTSSVVFVIHLIQTFLIESL